LKQGEIWEINLNPAVGAEIKKTRPCIIVSDDAMGILPLKIIALRSKSSALFQKRLTLLLPQKTFV
jgi:mRNA-degrading endonuclease toxin of MazEF toxin-antitoxin module